MLYILGAGRSGSTMLATALGEMDDFVNIGEARYLFNTRMISRDPPCGCGKQVGECPFWKDLLPIADEDTINFSTKWFAARNFPRLVLKTKFGFLREDKWKYVRSAYQELYSRVASRAGGNTKVIVDSSKHPANAYFLSLLPRIEVCVIHLVRDSRGVVGSWSHPKSYLRGRPTWRACLDWVNHNVLAECLRFMGTRYLRMRYEDFVASPSEYLELITHFIGEMPPRPTILAGNRLRLHIQHALAGNPDKLAQEGEMAIQLRERHQSRVSAIETALLTWPLLVRYGYMKPRARWRGSCR